MTKKISDYKPKEAIQISIQVYLENRPTEEKSEEKQSK